ncbi:MAG: hypothetical protein HY303_13290, partial [Candidatus Wallbacteria bacterium]|nr:hypothetical protein [Candidatus Wallbacteria bacterium]
MLTPGPTSPVEADGPGALWRRLLDWLDRLRTYGPAERRALAALESRTAGGPGQAAPLQGDPANAPAPAGLDDWLALVEFVALRGDYERAARVLARVPAGLRGEPAYDAARGAVLGDGMSRLAEMLLPGLPRRRVRQSIARTPSGQLIAVGDVVLEEVLEVREALLELKKTEASPHLVLLHMRSSLPEWRLQRFLERETAKRRPDVKDFEVRMEPGRMQVRCSFKGIPLTIGLVLELL